VAKKTTRKHVTLQLAGKFIAELAKVTYKVLGLFGSPKKSYHLCGDWYTGGNSHATSYIHHQGKTQNFSFLGFI